MQYMLNSNLIFQVEPATCHLAGTEKGITLNKITLTRKEKSMNTYLLCLPTRQSFELTLIEPSCSSKRNLKHIS